MRFAALASGSRTLGANGSSMGNKFVSSLDFLRTPTGAHFGIASFGGQSFVSVEKLFHLNDVIRERFGRRVDCGQAAADDHNRHLQLKIGDGIGFGGAGELQRQSWCSDAWRSTPAQAVLHRNHGGIVPAPAHRRYMIETQIERAVNGHGAAEPHAAKHSKFGAALQQQTNDL